MNAKSRGRIKKKREYGKLSSAIICLMVLVISIAITFVVRENSLNENAAKSKAQFDLEASAIQSKMLISLQSYQNAIEGARGLFNASNLVTREDWAAYVDALELSDHYPGISSLAYAQAIHSGDVDRFEEMAKGSGYAKYEVYPAEVSPELQASILYVEPFGENTATAIGYNIFSEPVRAAALKKSYTSNDPAMSGKILLLNDDKEDGYSTLMYVAVYDHSLPIETVEQRKDALEGFIFAPIRMTTFMQNAVGDTVKDSGINAVIYDGSKNDKLVEENRLYGKLSGKIIPKNSTTETLSIAGQTWHIKYWSEKTYFIGDAKNIPNIILIAGLIISVFISGILYLLLTSRHRAILFARKANSELQVERDNAVLNQRKDETILSGIAEGLAVYDEYGRILRINKAGEDMFGMAEKEVLGESYSTAYPAYDKSKKVVELENRPVARAFETGKPVTDVLYYKKKDKTFFAIQTTASPLIVNEQVIGAVAIFRDVTLEKEIDKRKTEFVSLASHQLKTPVGAIDWDVSLLLDGFYGEVSDEQTDALNQIHQMSVRMNELINGLLNVSRLEEGAYTVDPKPTRYLTIFNDVLQEMEARLNSKQQKISVECEENVPEIDLDRSLINIVVQNLVSNASKYSPVGSTINIKIEVTNDDIVARISNPGSPIPDIEKSKIFEKLYRASNANEQDAEGSGLGLYMVKEIVESTGGEIWYTSDEECTTFNFSFPRSGMIARVGQSKLTV